MSDIGGYLKTIRQNKKLKIDIVASELKIKAQLVLAIENNDFNKIGKDTYLKLYYIKTYAKYLDLSNNEIADLIKSLNQDWLSIKKEISTGTSAFDTIDGNKIDENKYIFPIRLVLTGVALFLLFTGLYIYYSSKFSVADYNVISNFLLAKQSNGLSLEYKNNRSYILLAKDKVKITLYNNKNEVYLTKILAKNEVFFLPQNSKLSVSSDRQGKIELYLDDDKNSFLGVLEKTAIYKKAVLR